MKKLLPILAVGIFACFQPAMAADLQKPSVTLTVRKQIIDSDHDLRGRQGSVRQKTLTLRVELVNNSPATIDGAELSGAALIMRAADIRENLIKETLGPLKLPAIKPNEKFTLELGRIRLGKVENRDRKIEETLEEWQVTCTRAGTTIGTTASSPRYETLAKNVVKPVKKKPAAARKKKQATTAE